MEKLEFKDLAPGDILVNTRGTLHIMIVSISEERKAANEFLLRIVYVNGNFVFGGFYERGRNRLYWSGLWPI